MPLKNEPPYGELEALEAKLRKLEKEEPENLEEIRETRAHIDELIENIIVY